MQATLNAAPSAFTDPGVVHDGRAQAEPGLEALTSLMPAPCYAGDVSATDCWSGGIEEISAMAAQLLAADACMIMLVTGNIGDRLTFRTYGGGLPTDDSAGKHQTRRGENAARSAIRAGQPMLIDGRSGDGSPLASSNALTVVTRIAVAPIRIGREIIGAINFFTLDRTRCDAALLAAAEIVASLVGQSLNALRLESLLHSRFAQLAIVVASDSKADQACAFARGEVGRLIRILAKSFYREMVRLGCDSGQIVDAASEIISQLSGSLKKHRDRLQRAPKTRLPDES